MFSRAVKGEDGRGRCLAPSGHSHSPWAPTARLRSSPFVKSTVWSLRLAPLSRREGSLEKW